MASAHAVPVAAFAFDRPLADAPRLVRGWCEPEAGFSWSLGAGCSLVVDAGGPGRCILIVRGHPFLHPPRLDNQRLIVLANGTEVARLQVDGLFTERIAIPAAISGSGRLDIEFLTPDSAAPSQFGAADTRQLGIRFWRIALFRLAPPPPAPPAARHPSTKAKAAAQFALIAAQPGVTPGELALCRTLTNAQHLLPGAALDPFFRNLFCRCLVHGQMLAATWMARRASGASAITLAYDPAAGTDPAVVRFTKTQAGHCIFGLSPALVPDGRGHANPGELVLWHLLAVLRLFTSYAASARPAGTCLVNLGDEGHAPGLTFCNLRSLTSWLIPDPYFMATSAYADFKSATAAQLPWQSRTQVALWRGASTGYRGPAGILDLPRVRLCRLAAQAGYERFLDAGITASSQVRDATEAVQLQQAGVMKPYIEAAEFQRWAFNIDIDGNTNSWPGLFTKLLCGSVVLKVQSQGPYRQWYYDRLVPFEHFVPVQSDLSDLIEKIRILQSNPVMAEAIGRRGRALALSMSLESEIEQAQIVIETAILLATQDLDRS